MGSALLLPEPYPNPYKKRGAYSRIKLYAICKSSNLHNVPACCSGFKHDKTQVYTDRNHVRMSCKEKRLVKDNSGNVGLDTLQFFNHGSKRWRKIKLVHKGKSQGNS